MIELGQPFVPTHQLQHAHLPFRRSQHFVAPIDLPLGTRECIKRPSWIAPLGSKLWHPSMRSASHGGLVHKLQGFCISHRELIRRTKPPEPSKPSTETNRDCGTSPIHIIYSNSPGKTDGLGFLGLGNAPISCSQLLLFHTTF